MSKSKTRQLFADRETRTVYTFNGNPENARVDPTFAEDSQIQNMLMKFARGEISAREPFYADVSDFGDFRETQERVINLRRKFDELPSAVRNLMANDPSNFNDVVNDPRNREFLEQHGVLLKSPDNEPDGSAGTSGAGDMGAQPPKAKAKPEPKAEPKGEAL